MKAISSTSTKKSMSPSKARSGSARIDDVSIITTRAAILDGRHVRRLPKEVVAQVRRYSPKIPERDWAAIREFVLDAVAAAGEGTQLDMGRAVMIAAHFVQWAVNLQGLPLEPSALFNSDVIEAYCDSLGLGDGSVSTYRSVLRVVAKGVAPEANQERGRPISRRNIQDPYVAKEVEKYRAWAHGQSTEVQTRKAKLMLSAGAGAGLWPNEITAIRPQHVTISESGITIAVQGKSPRPVTLLAEWESMFRDAIDGVELTSIVWGNLHPESKNKNLITNFTEHCVGTAPVPSRLRASWIVTLLDRQVNMAVLFEAAGFKQFNNLHQYIPFLTRPGSQDSRTQLRGGERS